MSLSEAFSETANLGMGYTAPKVLEELKQNEIWKNLRALSQSRNCLVLTATQADAKSYEKNVLTMSNYSEDKRKFAHVTAMYGLNQDKHGREKKTLQMFKMS